jgi:threonyl-tRNA synthetase
VDFAVPPRFDLTFVSRDGQPETPLCIHRAPLGTHERMIGFLIEHYEGRFPVWLAPRQAVLIPIADRHIPYCAAVAARLTEAGLRAEVDDSGDRMANKIRKAQEQKIPYMLVVGDREVEGERVALRMRSGEDRGATPVEEFLAYARRIVAEKAYE